MYFLSVDERKLLLRKLLPEARSSGVVEELRGWNWDKPPLSPIYEGKLSVMEVAFQLCTSGHDLYQWRVLGLKGQRSSRSGGYASSLHVVARDVIIEAKRIILEYGPNCLPMLADLRHGSNKPIARNIKLGNGAQLNRVDIKYGSVADDPAPVSGPLHYMGDGRAPKELSPSIDAVVRLATDIVLDTKPQGEVMGRAGQSQGLVASGADGISEWILAVGNSRSAAMAYLVREHMARRVVSVVEEVLTRQPRIGSDALLSAALPVMVGYQLDGSLLGLRKHLTVDMLAVGEQVPILVKFGHEAKSRVREFHKLAIAGYAMVVESMWECPVNIGCVAYVSLARGRVTVEHDLFIIGDELRQQFVEARDERTRFVEEEIDPGVCAECFGGCHLYGHGRVS